MRALLDTHALLWFVLDDPQLSSPARMIIEQPDNEVFISPASLWEIAIKVRLGKIDLRLPYDEFTDRAILGNEFAILPIEPRHTSLLTTLAMHHKDPFDRLLVAQAKIEGLSLISADEVLDAYDVQRSW